MDFTKYVYLLSSKSLFFSKSDLLGDPYEGSKSHANIKFQPAMYKGMPASMHKQLSGFTKWIRQWTFVNCWHMNYYESAAMWKLYTKTNESIAIQSTYKRLYDCLPENVFLGVVKYVDYEKDIIPEGNSFSPFLHKRKSFEYEQELRAVIQHLPENRKIQYNKLNTKMGETIPINIENLVEAVYVSPESPKWFFDLVNEITKKYKFDYNIKHSLLDMVPVY